MLNVYFFDFMDKEFVKENMMGQCIWVVIEVIEKYGVFLWVGLFCGFWYEFLFFISLVWYGFDFYNKKVIFYDDGKQLINIFIFVQCGWVFVKFLSFKEFFNDGKDILYIILYW